MNNELSESEEKFRSLVENLNEIVYTLDENAKITYVSPNINALSSYTLSEITGRSFIDFVHPDDIEGRIEQFRKTILTASTGEEALEIFTQNTNRIDLVISDIVMPKMSGKEVYENVKTIKPDVKFLFTSGYTADIIKKHFVEIDTVEFIPKPFSPMELNDKLEKMLSR